MKLSETFMVFHKVFEVYVTRVWSGN